MDSGHSGSMQSSSGGEEDYDNSRGGESISSFLNNPYPQHQQQLLSHQPTLFNPHSHHNLDHDSFPQSLANSSANNTQYPNDFGWSRSGLRSEPPNNYGNFGNLTGSSSAKSAALGAQALSQAPFASTTTSSSSMPSHSTDHHQPNTANKNPKKRTRASRRAPTTVLTTDTTNFRQMVQEFTGIPTAPFSGGGGSPYSRRLDLFSTGSGLGPLYPLRPSAQKLQLSSLLPPSSSSPSLLNSSGMNMIDALVSSTSTNSGAAINATSNDFQMNSDLGPGLPKPTQNNLMNMQNQILSFQTLLKHHHPSSVMSSKSQGTNSTLPSFDELGMAHENVVIPSGDQAGSSDNRNIQRWRDHGGTSLNRGDHQQQNITTTFKFNCSASTTSEFHPDKGLENVSSGGEGTVGSWICPSD